MLEKKIKCHFLSESIIQVQATSLRAILVFFILTITFLHAAEQKAHSLNSKSINAVERFLYTDNIILEVEHYQQAVKLFNWLDKIRLTSIGHETIAAINQSGHQLTIFHDDYAIYSAGITGAPMTRNLTNGIGENVYIRFYLEMQPEGTNCVFGKEGDYIDYSAVHNLFHELSHARHKMNGTWLYHDSEGQAIREENIFRLQWSAYRYEKSFLRNENMAEEEVTERTGNGHG